MKKPRLIYLYLDDVRQCPQHIKDSFITITIRDYESAINTIHYCNELNLEFYLDFDHDLGEGYSGYDVAKYIVENKIPMTGYTVHSQNPVGAWNIHQLLSHYGYGRFEI